ncbi:unnamed protein product [Taenia asiatica]|uniref:EB domain-containing protein n=1 Tax=Taenia asiatica TaxID=60517 RepID=A0A0R3W0Y7_TAEAS|nr:unnamed protein product [Taenia asiatica]
MDGPCVCNTGGKVTPATGGGTVRRARKCTAVYSRSCPSLALAEGGASHVVIGSAVCHFKPECVEKKCTTRLCGPLHPTDHPDPLCRLPYRVEGPTVDSERDKSGIP